MKKCKLHGCERQLDENGYPLEYCDWQQGRCPMQKQKVTFEGTAFFTLIFILLFIIIWAIT